MSLAGNASALNKYESFFVESEAILGMMNEDFDYVDEVLEEFNSLELDVFGFALAALHAKVMQRKATTEADERLGRRPITDVVEGLRQLANETAP